MHSNHSCLFYWAGVRRTWSHIDASSQLNVQCNSTSSVTKLAGQHLLVRPHEAWQDAVKVTNFGASPCAALTSSSRGWTACVSDNAQFTRRSQLVNLFSPCFSSSSFLVLSIGGFDGRGFRVRVVDELIADRAPRVRDVSSRSARSRRTISKSSSIANRTSNTGTTHGFCGPLGRQNQQHWQDACVSVPQVSLAG